MEVQHVSSDCVSSDDMVLEPSNPQTETIKYNQDSQKQIFFPALSYQRKRWVCEFIDKTPSITSVTDFGCGNGRILNFLKTIPHLELINFVDSDRGMLEVELDYNFTPGICEIMFGRSNSNKDMHIRVYHGNVTVPDKRFAADCISMIEVIEHMEPADVERATRTIFSYYQPKFVIITTPNSDFNHLLRQPGESNLKFRHFDHKFEWTRAEFVAWANQVCTQYPQYSYQLDGVGHLPNSEPYGPCTQIVLFTRNTDLKKEQTEIELDCFDLAFDALNVKDGYYEVGKKQVTLLSDTLYAGSKHKIEPVVYEQIDW